eukprot:TRINITY_DN68647_c0_g1_i1.p1 TRINITY_DN68647_c0_g1~~TRINITY_DN68647_c0_g1_i1.p1  ORF type:complete len:567 (-),score=98.62 TRINITY_DN68647_c0_g1_i1:611-2311(-)
MHFISSIATENATVRGATSTRRVVEVTNGVGICSSHCGNCPDSAPAGQPVVRFRQQALHEITNLQASCAQVPSNCSASAWSHIGGSMCNYNGGSVGMQSQEVHMYPRREALHSDRHGDAKAILDEAVNVVVSCLGRCRLDVDWTSWLSLKMLELVCCLAAPSDLMVALERHGWWKTQFIYAPDLDSLLLSLEQLRALFPAASQRLHVTAGANQLPIPMQGAGSGVAEIGWHSTYSQFQAATTFVAAQATTAYDYRTVTRDVDVGLSRDMQPTVAAKVTCLGSVACGKLEPTLPSAQPPTSELAAEPKEDMHQVSDYTAEIVHNMLILEVEELPPANYMDIQPTINAKMRAILIDWLVLVMLKYHLRDSTLFLAVSIIDRYLSRAVIVRERLQLVGIAAAMIAAKYDEISPPAAKEFRYVAADIYTVAELFEMESAMLNLLDFQLACPTVFFFLDYFCWIIRCDGAHRERIQYVAELSLLEMHALTYTPSKLAAAAVLLGNEMVGLSKVWPCELASCTQFEEKSLEDCATWLRGLFNAAPSQKLQAVRDKFSSKKRFEVAHQHKVFI